MKQSAAKTLGVAALGAAFAAAGAGAASAAPALPDTAPALDTVNHALPAENLPGAVPSTDRVLEQGQDVAGGLTDARSQAEELVPAGTTAPVAGLLGGMPVNGHSLA
ncbi:ATP-binding protein [Streptomyces sp. NPDC005931]|uniref:ATP-binding protein n=1 Tax=Streptomyces sp. NPDC005931 TaxID=3364737 RepID=UPI00369CA05E